MNDKDKQLLKKVDEITKGFDKGKFSDYQWELVIDLLKTALRKISDDIDYWKKRDDNWKILCTDQRQQLKESEERIQGYRKAMVNREKDVEQQLKQVEENIDDSKEWLIKEINTLPTDISRKQLEVQLMHIIPKAYQKIKSLEGK